MALQWTELGDVLARFETRLTAIEQKLSELNGQAEWMDAEQAAIYLSTTVPAIRAAERGGKLKGHRGGGRVRFLTRDLDAFATSENE